MQINEYIHGMCRCSTRLIYPEDLLLFCLGGRSDSLLFNLLWALTFVLQTTGYLVLFSWFCVDFMHFILGGLLYLNPGPLFVEAKVNSH